MTALGTQWGTDRDCITPRKTLKHTYYEEAGGCEMWKLHQMDRTTENHNTSYSVPAGHPLISCLLFSFSCKQRERMQQKQLHRLTVKACANLKQRHKRPQELWIYMWYILCLFLVSHRYVWCRIFRFFTYMSYWLQLYLVKVQKGEKKWNFFPPHLLEPFITIVKTI